MVLHSVYSLKLSSKRFEFTSTQYGKIYTKHVFRGNNDEASIILWTNGHLVRVIVVTRSNSTKKLE